MSLAKKINAIIASHGCHMQQEESLLEHIVEHADEIRGSAVTAFNAAIEELNKAHDAAVKALEEKIQALTSELAAERAGHTDAKQVASTTADEREAIRRAHLRTVDDSDAGKEHLADEGETDEFTSPHGEPEPEAEPAKPKKAAAKPKAPAAKSKSKRK